VGTFRGSFAPIEARLDVGADGQARLTGSASVSDVIPLPDGAPALADEVTVTAELFLTRA
jgi:hypothetical protein